jgi:hypothetical protein
VLGCDQSQGYFMGKPMPIETLEIWLKESMYSKVSAVALYAGRPSQYALRGTQGAPAQNACR